MIFFLLYNPVNFIVSWLTMINSRHCEYQADAFAVKYGHAKALKEGLIDIFIRNKAPLVADWLYSALNHSHPTLFDRISAIDAIDPENESVNLL